MLVDVSISYKSPLVSVSNIVQKVNSRLTSHYNVDIHFLEVRSKYAENEYSLENLNHSRFFQSGYSVIEGTLLDNKKKPISYSPVFLYGTVSGHLIDRTATDVSGNYKFDRLLPNYSYMVVSYDREFKNNATILEFTLKEETNE